MSDDAARFSRSTPSATLSSVSPVVVVSCFEKKKGEMRALSRESNAYGSGGGVNIRLPMFRRFLLHDIPKLFSEICPKKKKTLQCQCLRKPEQFVGRTEQTKRQTFYNGRHIVWPIPITGKELADLDPALQLPPEQVAFVQKQNELRPRKKLRGTYRRPENERIFEPVDAWIFFQPLVKH
jgi:hypothetical protein